MNECHDNIYRPYFKTKTNKKYEITFSTKTFFIRKYPILIHSAMLIIKIQLNNFK